MGKDRTLEIIKTEIERLKEEAYNSILPDEPKYRTHYKVGKKELCEELLSFLSTLESEKPMNQEGLKEEIHKYNKERFDEYFPEQEGDFISEVDFMTCLDRVARHFAKWGAEHTPFPEDTVLFNKGIEEGKRLMMDEAVEGYVTLTLTGVRTVAATIKEEDNIGPGDKVRVIVLPKECEK